MSSLNDLSWYSANPQLLTAAGQFPFPYRPGMALPMATPASGVTEVPVKIPGVMALNWIPSFGINQATTDPASIAGKEIYARVRSVYSGALEADAPDFIVYLGALDSIFSYIGWLKRVYRALTTFSPDNFALPDAVLMACHLNMRAISALRQDKVRLWQGINELILKSRKFRCPAVMDYFNRHYWMSDNIYADAPSTMAQFYLFNLAGVFALEMLPVSGGSADTAMGLQIAQLPDFSSYNPTTGTPVHNVCDTLINFGDELIQKLDSWDDGYTISGYLTRAYDTPNFIVAELLQEEQLTAQYVPEVLTQIENSRAVLTQAQTLLLFSQKNLQQIQVTQNVIANCVISNTSLRFTGASATSDSIAKAVARNLPNGVNPCLSIRSEQPTVADTVIASRLQANAVWNVTTTAVTVSIVAGTEIPLYWMLHTLPDEGSQYSGLVLSPYFASNLSDGTNPVSTSVVNFIEVQQFDWHPFFFLIEGNGSTGTEVTVHPMGDTHNITVVSLDSLKNLHKVCFYSEFNSFAV